MADRQIGPLTAVITHPFDDSGAWSAQVERPGAMGLLIDRDLLQAHWLPDVSAWQRAGHSWWLLGRRGDNNACCGGAWEQESAFRPDGRLDASALLADWLAPAGGPARASGAKDRQILLSASSALLVLAKEQGLLTLGPSGADHSLSLTQGLGPALTRLLARRLTLPWLREPALSPEEASQSRRGARLAGAICLRPLVARDASWIAAYCQDAAIARYTLNIPHPYPEGAASDWLQLCGRKQGLGQAWSWAIWLEGETEAAPVGTVSLSCQGSLAWWVGVPWQGLGIATRAAILVRDFAFASAHLPEINGCHMAGNLASGRVMAKLGMSDLGMAPLVERPDCVVRHWRLGRGVRGR